MNREHLGLAVLALITLAMLLIAAVGFVTPRQLEVSSSRQLDASPAQIYAVLSRPDWSGKPWTITRATPFEQVDYQLDLGWVRVARSLRLEPEGEATRVLWFDHAPLDNLWGRLQALRGRGPSAKRAHQGLSQLQTALQASAHARSAHGTLLYADAQAVLVQHDNTLGRVVAGVGRYRPAPGLDTGSWAPGQHLSLWLSASPSGVQLDRAEVDGPPDPLPERFVAGGYPLRGQVVRVDQTTVMLDHQAVEGLMPAMVMPLHLGQRDAASLSPGDQIQAQLLVSDYGYQLVGVEVVGHQEGGLRVGQPLAIGDQLAALTVATPRGPVRLGAGQGRPTALAFLYTTCPDPAACPATVLKLAALQPLLPQRARILSLSLDPSHDTLEVLADYGAGVGAQPGRWWLGRVDGAPLDSLAMQAGMAVTVRSGHIVHDLRLLLLDADGRLIARYDDNAWQPSAVARQLR